MMAYTRLHGRRGKVVLSDTEDGLKPVAAYLGIATNEVAKELEQLPSISVSKCNGLITVTWNKWHKYQGDDSSDRVRRHRANVTVQKRGEEKRRTAVTAAAVAVAVQQKKKCPECSAALDELNRLTSRHYNGAGKSLANLHARHTEHGLEAVLRVIRTKTRAWINSDKWSRFLRPETLFGPTKFDGYVNEPELPGIDPGEEARV